MVPFDNFAYFAILLFVLPAALALRLVSATARAAILLSTIVMLAIQYGGAPSMGGTAFVGTSATLAAHAIYQSVLVASLAALARRRRSIEPARRARPPQIASYLALTLSILPLAIVKFRPESASWIGYLGLSYVTFRSLDVLFSIHDGVIDRIPALEFLAFLFCFSTISAGPIDRYRRFTTDWHQPRNRAALVSDLDTGVHKVFTGFFYKFVLAALIAQRWMNPASHHHGAGALLSFMYAYSFNLFFDFAGYSAFAIGVSYMLGVHAPENFRRPFFARNIREFWDRWHISLSWWFRDHIYMRFLMMSTKRRWFASRYVGSYTGLILSFGLMGIWHGPQLRYVIYGLYHAALLIGHDVYKRVTGRTPARDRSWPTEAWTTALTFHAVCFGFLIFSGRLIS